ncbi:SRPBCC family protein [Parafilimonas sp.]|uniref:SRPBCC family protein n=1 Tax=Parafilimonas sp. TaxID=1969739 RepID=UPI0039E2B339
MHNYKLSGNAFEPRATKLYESSSVINVGKTGRIASLAAGAVLYSIAASGKQQIVKKALRYGGIYFLYRGISGNCLLTALLKREEFQMHTRAVNIRTYFIVKAPRQLVYESWRNLERLPRFLKHIKKIKVTDELHSLWVLKTPRRLPTVAWKAEIIDQEEGRELSWRSLSGSKIETSGKITFANTTGGTEVNVTISYRPPAGYIGSAAATIINHWLKDIIKEDLARFKKYIEAKAIDYSHSGSDFA